jgi:hypothetical protein
MSSSHGLYNRLFAYLRAVHPEPHVKRISNWVWIIVGMILSHSVQLSQIAQHVPTNAEAAGRIMQIRRWLSNRLVRVEPFYRPLIKAVLSQWAGRAAYVILDTTSVNHGKLQVLRLSLAHGLRALPLTWLVIEGKGLVKVERVAPLFKEAQRLLQSLRAVTFLADRGFRDHDWAENCLKLGWNYLIRIANNTYFTLSDGREYSIEQLGLQPGQSRYFAQVRLTHAAAWTCNLLVTCTVATAKRPSELCALISNLPATARTLRKYLRRMQIDESFRDDKSGTFALEQTHLTDPERLNHLLLALSVAMLWIHEIGQQVLHTQQRKEIDPASQRQLSIVQLGWRKLRRAISSGSIPLFTLTIRPMRLAPVVVAPAQNRKG